MTIAFASALFLAASRDTWLSFGIGVAVGLAFVLISKRMRRKEDR